MTRPPTPPPILYVEDDENDVFLMKRAFTKAGITNPIAIVRDGSAAIGYLTSAIQPENAQARQLPALVLLDLNMPGKSGIEVLKSVRAQSALADLPVVILTSSNQQRDIDQAYSNGASSFLIKPNNPGDMIKLAKGIKGLWLRGTGGGRHNARGETSES